MQKTSTSATRGGFRTTFVSVLAAAALTLGIAMPAPAWAATAVNDEAGLESAVATGGDIMLEADIVLTKALEIVNDVNIDLGGNTLTAASGEWGLKVNDAEVTIDNGTIEGDSHVIRVENGADVTLGSDLDVNSTGGTGALVISGSTLNTSADITVSGGYGAIQGNGSAGNGDVTVNVTGGSVTSDDVAIYFPNTTELNVSGGEITGASGIYIKSGSLNITGGEITANGDWDEYSYNNNGCNSTGDAVIIEACDYPGGVPTVSISGGKFYSDLGSCIGYYQQAVEYALENTQFVSGGTFSDFSMIEYIAEGSTIVDADPEPYVTTVEDAESSNKYKVTDGPFTYYTNNPVALDEGYYDAVECAVQFEYVTADGQTVTTVVFVPVGETVAADQIPTVPERDGFEFEGWDGDTSVVIEDATAFTATYAEAQGSQGGQGGDNAAGDDADGKDDAIAESGKETVTMTDGSKPAIPQTGDGNLLLVLPVVVALAGCLAGGAFLIQRRNAA